MTEPFDQAEATPAHPPLSPRRRGVWWKVALGVVGVLAAGAGVGWALAEVFLPQAAVEDAPYTLVTVEPGSVEAFQAVNARAVWHRTPVAANLAAGTVTEVTALSGEALDAGTVLYRVDLRPVIVMQGSVPAFRDMGSEMEGADIAQLQTFLSEHDYLGSFDSGTWGYSTTRAVRAWQKDVGLPVDGVVSAGSVVFVPTLPAQIMVDTKVIRVGARLGGGEDAVFQLDPAPAFTLPVSNAQAASLPVGSRVEITSPGGETWNAWINDQLALPDESGIDLILGSTNDGTAGPPICGEACGQVPIDPPEGAVMRTRVITVELREGLVIPSAALTTTSDGKSVLVDADGLLHPVTALAGARGMTVIEGVEAGLKVRAPAEAP